MKLVELALLLAISCLCRSTGDKSGGGVGIVSEAEEFSHEEFDQEMLAGGMDGRKQIKDLTPEEATKEIRKLVSRMDGDGDGKLSKQEIVRWLERVDERSYQAEADDLFQKEDTDGDGYITMEEYWMSSEGEELPSKEEDMTIIQEGVGSRFIGADSDLDGRLDKAEFSPFVHPFRHEHMMGHLVEDQLVLYDMNQDEKISLEEFTNALNPEGLPEDELPEFVAEERIAFKDRFDKDHDGFLGTEEIKLWLAPNEKEFFEEEAKHLLKHSDKDEDGFLSLDEVEAEFSMFAESPVTEYGYVAHEEL